jgi:hypothetical protein
MGLYIINAKTPISLDILGVSLGIKLIHSQCVATLIELNQLHVSVLSFPHSIIFSCELLISQGMSVVAAVFCIPRCVLHIY